MATNTPAVVTPISGATGINTQSNFLTSPTYNGNIISNAGYSGTFIPTLWSAKMNAKFYAASVFADICNRDWEGDVKNLGDKVVINNIPTITISDYQVGNNLTYQTPVANALELVIDRAKVYAFSVSDVLDYQSKPDLMNTFSQDAAEQMRIVIDSTCIYRNFSQGAAANRGATAGVRSASFNLGTDAAPVALTGANVLQKILELASVLDEQNVPDSGRWLVIDPLTRTLLMQSNLAQAQFMGDDKSMVRNGLIGTIDRFKVYVSNLLPTGAAGTAIPWVSGDGSENSVTTTGTVAKRRAIIAGHPTAIAFASQMTKTEQLRNPNDFGDMVRGLQVFGHKVVKPESLALLIAA
jgi:hypothetical protein